MFAYCLNNPTNRCDSSGRCSKFLGFLWKIDCLQATCPDSKIYISPKCVDPIGTYNNGQGLVFIVKPDLLSSMANAESNAVVIVDMRMNSNDSCYNQDIQIRNSYKITDQKHQEEIIDLILKYNAQNPVVPAWSRTKKSMLIEWRAHNDGHSFAPIVKAIMNRDIYENTAHVDFDNKDEPLGYWDYYRK